MDAAAHLVRRSRLRSFAAGAGHFLNLASSEVSVNSSDNEKRYNPDLTYGTDITNEAVTSTVKTTSTAKTTATVKTSTSTSKAATSTVKATSTTAASTTKVAAQAATIGTTRTSVTTAVTTSKAAAYVTTSTTSTISTTSITSSSAVTSSKVTTTSSSSTSKTTSSTPTSTSHSTSATPSTTSKSATVITITSNNAVATSSSSSAKTSATAAASNSSSTKGMSTSSKVGIVAGVVVGIIALGAVVAWLYRKYSSRSYSTKSPWSKLDDDITPFPSSFEKNGNGAGDIYGSTNTAPVIGSRRALALARSNAFNPDGSIRPDSEIYERDNRAGLGAGGMSFSPYPTLQQPAAAGMYGLDPHGRPYNPHAGRTPMDHTIDAQYVYDDDPYQYPMPSSRQLVGPPAPMPVAMPMGRPTAPSTDAEFAQAEDFADIPEPYTPGLAYADGAPITPMHENANHTWPNEKEQRGMTTPQTGTSPLINIEPVVTPPSAPVMRMPLPTFAPLSPLSSSFNLNRHSQPLAMYEDEQSQQKRMYGEVAQSAGIDEPTTPNTATDGLNDSTTSTTSSFSATTAPIHNSLPTLTAMPRLPELSLAPPPMTQPYQHGQPLSPLNEVPTPLSTMSTPSNPFDSAPAYQQPHSLAPPYSVSASSPSFPSPLYPPPSPGGMSVPGSVTDSPRRWSGVRGQATRVVSTYQDEDAYGGI